MKRLIKPSITLLTSFLILSGCTMKQTIEKQGGKELSEDSTIEDLIDDVKPVKKSEDESDQNKTMDDYEMSDEQKELLKEAESQKVAEAIKFNETNLSKLTELTKTNIVKREAFTNVEEFATYVSYELFAYHTLLTNGETFYNNIKNYIHTDFENLLPAEEDDRVNMFETLQEVFTELLEHDITSYEVSEVQFTHMRVEGYFYRKYTLSNGVNIFYKTVIKQNDKGEWLMLDDSPSDGYVTTDKGPIFKSQFIENKGA